jgi:glycosyltransferase involved in cell wall biosynthesis
MTAPLVSIIIPTHNREKVFPKSVDSVLKQTYKNWELIIIDDRSSDNTKNIINQYSQKDNRIHYFKNRHKQGPAGARNQGIELAKGEFIAFLDSDDIWYTDKLKKCLKKLEAGADLVCHGMRYIKDGKYWKDVMCGPEKMAAYSKLLYNGSCIVISATVVRKECLRRVSGFDENPVIISAEDYELWLKLAQEKIRFSFINEILGEYTCHNSNISNQGIRHLNANIAVVNKHFLLGSNYALLDFLKLRRIKALFLYGAARSFYKNGRMWEALTLFLRSLLLFPFLPRVYCGLLLNFLPYNLCVKMGKIIKNIYAK